MSLPDLDDADVGELVARRAGDLQPSSRVWQEISAPRFTMRIACSLIRPSASPV